MNRANSTAISLYTLLYTLNHSMFNSWMTKPRWTGIPTSGCSILSTIHFFICLQFQSMFLVPLSLFCIHSINQSINQCVVINLFTVFSAEVPQSLGGSTNICRKCFNLQGKSSPKMLASTHRNSRCHIPEDNHFSTFNPTETAKSQSITFCFNSVSKFQGWKKYSQDPPPPPLTLGIPDWIHSARILSLSPEKLELSSESSGLSTSPLPLEAGSSASFTPSKRASSFWASVSSPSPSSDRTERSECDPAWDMLAGVPSVQ
jgi:hypothetical protein